MEISSGPKFLLAIGALLFGIGLIWHFAGPFLSGIPFGRLPGDIAIERENFKFYFPLTSGIVLSVILSLLLWLARKF